MPSIKLIFLLWFKILKYELHVRDAYIFSYLNGMYLWVKKQGKFPLP